MPESTSTESLLRQVESLSPDEMRSILAQILTVWWIEDGDVLFDKQLNSDHLEEVTLILCQYHLSPLRDEHPPD